MIEESLFFWCLAIFVVYIIGVSKSGFAGGAGVIAVPLMSIVISPQAAAALLLPILLFIDALNMRVFWPKRDAVLLPRLLLGSFFGVVIGALCFGLFNVIIVKIIVGFVAVICAANNMNNRQKLLKPVSVIESIIWSVLSGFASFICHAGGPPINAYMLKLSFNKITLLSTIAVFAGITNLMKLPAYAILGQLNINVGWFAFAMAPIAYAGVYSGMRVKDLISDETYMIILNRVLLVVGFYLITTNTTVLFLSV